MRRSSFLFILIAGILFAGNLWSAADYSIVGDSGNTTLTDGELGAWRVGSWYTLKINPTGLTFRFIAFGGVSLEDSGNTLLVGNASTNVPGMILYDDGRYSTNQTIHADNEWIADYFTINKMEFYPRSALVYGLDTGGINYTMQFTVPLNMVLDGRIVVNSLNSYVPTVGQKWVLFSTPSGSTVTGSFSTVTSGYSVATVSNALGGYDVVLEAVPEPTTYMLMGLGLLALVAMGVRRAVTA